MKFYELKEEQIEGECFVPSVTFEKMTPSLNTMIRLMEKEPFNESIEIDYFIFDDYGEAYLKEFNENNLFDIYTIGPYIGPSNGNCLLVSPKMKALLETVEITTPYIFYPARLLVKGEKIDYSVLQVYKIFNSINFEKSKFWLCDSPDDQRLKEFDDTVVNDGNHYMEIQETLYNANKTSLRFKSIVYPIYFDISYGLWGGLFIVSEKLKETIEKEGMKGVAFKELDFEVHFMDSPNV
jgi:hypothetical protein